MALRTASHTAAEIIKSIFGSPPSDLTTEQKRALIAAIGALTIEVARIPAVTTLQPEDLILIGDNSDADKAKRLTLGSLLGQIAGDNLTANGLQLDAAGGGSATIADNSIAAAKALADTDQRRKDWRDRIEATHVNLYQSTLPATSEYSVNRDFVILARPSANTGVSFRDISDPSTALTVSNAGDVFWLLANGWVRVGNVRELSEDRLLDVFKTDRVAADRGKVLAISPTDENAVALHTPQSIGSDATARAAAAAADQKAVANKEVVDRLPVFAHLQVTPNGIIDNLVPSFITIDLDQKLLDKTITRIDVLIAGNNVASLQTAQNVAPFNLVGRAGGLINASLASSVRNNIISNISTSDTTKEGEIRYRFSDNTTAIDHFNFAVNNAGFRRRGFREIAAVAGASRTWTFQLSPADTEILVDLFYGGTNNINGHHTRLFPRALFSGSNQQFVVDSRVASANFPDEQTGGFTANINGSNLLTVVTTGWKGSGTPRIFAK